MLSWHPHKIPGTRLSWYPYELPGTRCIRSYVLLGQTSGVTCWELYISAIKLQALRLTRTTFRSYLLGVIYFRDKASELRLTRTTFRSYLLGVIYFRDKASGVTSYKDNLQKLLVGSYIFPRKSFRSYVLQGQTSRVTC